MLKSILVGLDGSSYGKRAEELALEWGKKHNSHLVGMGIIDEPGVRQGEALPLGASMFKEHRDQMKLEKAQLKVRRLLDKFAERCKAARVRFRQIEQIGVPYERILEECQRHDLILLGQQTYFEHDADDEVPGETLHQVLKHSPRPVLTVPKRLSDGEGIAIAYDGSLQAAHVLQIFQLLQIFPNESLHVITVHANLKKATAISRRAQDYLHHHGRCVIADVVATDVSPADVILGRIQSQRPRALVMGAYGRSRLRSFFFGSITKTILKKASIPLFLYH